MILVGVDVGGTFTDLVLTDLDTGSLAIHKVPTTSHDPALGVMTGLTELCARENVGLKEVDHVYHGTTIATNTMLEHDGAKTGMITTKGFRDILHIGRHQRPYNYSIMQEIPWQDHPLVRRRHRLSVKERLSATGEVIDPLDDSDVRAAAKHLKDEGVEAIAICFLFSFVNPIHENRARELVAEEFPDAFVTTSSSVSPQFREFERFTTAAINAFVGPRVHFYINNLKTNLKHTGSSTDLKIMASNGGVATVPMVAEKPVITLLSGPAAGVLGGAWAGKLADRDRLITFDVGGTSADIGLIVDGKFAEASARDTSIAGFPVMIPMIAIHTIGAGGGSIAYRDASGAFRVGPRSAGARPGPAAYGFGGDQPTVTDAHLVLGRLSEEDFLGGDMRLDSSAARKVIGELAHQLGMGETATAEGILAIANNNMAEAVRSRTVQRGLDPRTFALMAFGGAGPLHGADVAAMLGIPEVIVPPYPGINAALGLLTTDIRHDAVKTEFMVEGATNFGQLDRNFRELEALLRERLKADGVGPKDAVLQRSGDLRYAGQGYELRIPFAEGELAEDRIEAVWKRFHSHHLDEYGHAFDDRPIEIVNIRVTAVGPGPKIQTPEVQFGDSIDTALARTRRTTFRFNGRLVSLETAFYRRSLLPADREIDGPAVILQSDATTVVPPGATARTHRSGNLIIRLKPQT
jgi:N-methylhydantoinase A